MVHFGEFLKNWSLRSNSVTRQVSFNKTKIGGKCQNSNATFCVIFKHCALVWTLNWITKVKLEMNCWSNLVIVTETFLLVFGYRGQHIQQVYFVRYDKAKETTTEPLLEKVWTIYQQQTTLLSATSRGKNVFSIVMKCMK